VLWAKECASTLSPFVVFTFGLVVESIKELGGASRSQCLLGQTSNNISLQSKRSDQMGRNNRHGPKGAIISSLGKTRGINVGGRTIFA
jgi:hypothetical protein